MATLNYYVDANIATGNHDGSDWANAYATLALCEAGKQQDLTDAGGDVAIINCKGTAGTADASAVTVDGWTMNATCYLAIQGDATSGVWNATKYHLEGVGKYLNIADTHVRIINMQLYGTNASAAEMAITVGDDIRIDSCIIRGGSYSIITSASCVSLKIWNSIIYGAGNDCVDNTVGTTTIYSSILAKAGRDGFREAGGTTIAKNCYSGSNVGVDYGTVTMTTCASEDATGSAGLQTIAFSTDTFTNVGAGTEDFRLVSGSALIDAGTDTSGDADPLNFTDDITGTTRTGTWDIGPFNYVAAVIQKFMHYYRLRRA